MPAVDRQDPPRGMERLTSRTSRRICASPARYSPNPSARHDGKGSRVSIDQVRRAGYVALLCLLSIFCSCLLGVVPMVAPHGLRGRERARAASSDGIGR